MVRTISAFAALAVTTAYAWDPKAIDFKEQTGWNGVLQEYAMPRLYNLTNDPGETDNVLFLHAWFPKAALPQLEEYFVSLKQYPPIFASQKDPYKLPKYP